MTAVSSVIMLAGINYGAQYGGSITSILVNIPGEASAVLINRPPAPVETYNDLESVWMNYDPESFSQAAGYNVLADNQIYLFERPALYITEKHDKKKK